MMLVRGVGLLGLLSGLACAHEPARTKAPWDLPDPPGADRRIVTDARARATSEPATATSEPATSDATATPDHAEAGPSARTTDPWRGRVVVVGHSAARFAFTIPAGLAPLRGVTPPADARQRTELASQGPDGVGIADGKHVAVDSIVVFSDPEGIGADFLHLSPADRQQVAARYGDAMRERFPDAGQPQIVRAGSHLALRVELPRVDMPNRPARRGRHFLVFDHRATASVDCLWTAAHAARMASACDAIAAELERRRSHR